MIRVLTDPRSLHVLGRGQRRDVVVGCDQGHCQAALQFTGEHDMEVIALRIRDHRPHGWFAAKRGGVPVERWKYFCGTHAPVAS